MEGSLPAPLAGPAARRERNARVRRLSLPREHGAYLSLAGATAAACLVAPHPWPALGTGLCLAAAFFARGPVDRLASRVSPLAWDRAFLLFLVAVAATGLWLASSRAPVVGAVAGATLLAIPAASAALRFVRLQRAAGLELAAMALLGASAGLAARAGGTDAWTAVALAAAIGAHAVVSVPIVRSELHRGERRLSRRALLSSAAALAAAAVLLAVIGRPLAAFALLPRAGQIGLRLLRPPRPRRPAIVGLVESALLALAVAIAALALVLGTSRA
jgi:hypothetical protein